MPYGLRSSTALAFALWIPAQLTAQETRLDNLARVATALDTRAATSNFSGVLLLGELDGKGGRTVVAGAHGVADLGAGVPVTLETRFVTGSTAKAFTAVAIL